MELVKKKKKWIPWVLVAAVILGALIYWNYQSRAAAQEPEYTTYTLKPREPLVLKGASQVTEAVAVAMDPSKGEVADILVKTGQKVKAGDELFSYQSGAADDNLTDARRGLARADEAVQQAREDLAQAKDDQSKDKGRLERAQSRLEKSQKALRGAQKDLAEAQAEQALDDIAELNDTIREESDNVQKHSQAAARYQGRVDSWPDRIDGLEKSLDQAKNAREDAALRFSRAQANQRQVETAEIPGYVRVTETNRRNPQAALVEIVSEETEIRATVTEYDYFRLRSGLPVKILIVSTKEEVAGTIETLEPLPQSNQSLPGQAAASSVNYAFTVKPQRPIQPGYSVEIEIALEETVIPSAAIINEGDATFLWVYADAKVSKKPVTLRRSGAYWILEEGLENGAVIIQNPDERLQEGASIKVALP